MKKFCIITNNEKDNEYVLTNKISNYIDNNGGQCFLKKDLSNDNNQYRYTDPSLMPNDLECVITIGGDGTLLQAARDLNELDVVFIGINKGDLGFMAETGTEDVENTLDRLLKDDFKIESRMMLEGTIIRDAKKVYSTSVLNDIVIHRGGDIRISDFYVYVNNQLLSKYEADGIILSTPTGSTAYNLSAGGPVARPNSDLIILTPICAHSISQRSIVLSANDEIIVEIGTGRNPKEELRIIAFDGDNIYNVTSGDRIKIAKSELHTKVVKLDESSFLQILKDKMGDR